MDETTLSDAAGARADHVIGGDGRTARVVISPVEGRAVLNLRTVPQPGMGVFASVLGLELPTTAGRSTTTADGTVRALWTGPGDWLIACPDTARLSLESSLRTVLEGMSGALTDVGHGFVVFNLSGPAAVDVLAQGCGLDLDPSAFSEGMCAMTALARMQVVIHRLPQGDGYDVYVARSYAESLWHWVTVAAMEYGYRVRR